MTRQAMVDNTMDYLKTIVTLTAGTLEIEPTGCTTITVVMAADSQGRPSATITMSTVSARYFDTDFNAARA